MLDFSTLWNTLSYAFANYGVYPLEVIIGLFIFLNIVLFFVRKPRLQLLVNMLLFAGLFAASSFMYLYDIYPQTYILSINSFSLFFAMLFTVSMALVNIMASGSDEYNAFAMFSSFILSGMYLVSFAGSFVALIIGLELMVIPTVLSILAGKPKSIESAAKLFIMSSIAVALFTFGAALIFGSSFSLSFAGIQQSQLTLMATILIVAAVGFEASIFPFNLWVPDVYQGSQSYITGMLGGINKKVGFVALFEIAFLALRSYSGTFTTIFYALAILTMFYGNIIALAQKNVKRMLAYSSISQAGYILIGFAVATNYSVTASVFQIFAHAFMFIGALAVIAHMEMQNRHEVNDYIGLYSENKFAAIALTIMFISMIGTPLTAGFIGKFLLFSSAVYHNMLPLAVLAITASVISVYYYLKVIMAMFTNKEFSKKSRMRINLLIVALICLIVIVAVGIYPNPVISLAGSAASALNMT